jgi:hypothetical protein
VLAIERAAQRRRIGVLTRETSPRNCGVGGGSGVEVIEGQSQAIEVTCGADEPE